jgi:L-2-hydroxyglutarate oxidase LhgO
LNYTAERRDGSIDISKVLAVNGEFDLSRQFWAYLVKKGAIKNPQSFIHAVPHCSFVRGEDNIAFLRKRFDAKRPARTRKSEPISSSSALAADRCRYHKSPISLRGVVTPDFR